MDITVHASTNDERGRKITFTKTVPCNSCIDMAALNALRTRRGRGPGVFLGCEVVITVHGSPRPTLKRVLEFDGDGYVLS